MMRLHWWKQNLTQNHKHDIERSILRHGRGGVWLRNGNDDQLAYLGAEWMLFGGMFHLTLSTGEEEDFTAGLACGVFGLWIHLDFLPYKWIKGRFPRREVTIRIHDGAIRWRFWQPVYEWNNKTSKWLDGDFSLVDFAFGRREHSEYTLSTEENAIYMPEASYPVTVRIFRSTWKRPRWPSARRMVRSEVTMHVPIPVPGKGENSWDCNEDAVHSITAPMPTVHEALGHVVTSVYRTRRKYGGKNWKPEPVKA